jgi:hypothetical protein
VGNTFVKMYETQVQNMRDIEMQVNQFVSDTANDILSVALSHGQDASGSPSITAIVAFKQVG